MKTKWMLQRQEKLYGIWFASRAFSAVKTTPIDELSVSEDAPLLSETLRPYFLAKQPVVIRQAMMGAPALQHWKDWGYLEQMVDREAICHVEIGGNYSKSKRADIRLGDYLAYIQMFEERYGRSGGEPPAKDLVYLAQNDLAQGLEQDFELPPFVSELGDGRLYSVMTWIGPYGCSSPLHFDPMDNALMQFVGAKKVTLYPPGTEVYAGEEVNQHNTSPINFEDEALDLERYPLLENLPPAIVCTLTAGDLLYMPRKWWHQVRTIETSVSVSAWWR
ncbi:hypothetical protein MHU86_7671 [Fragilaria crotonensis]|nr:hypothetical protein MHU86_7671 [Fragilaria crotonensis]